MDLFLVPERTVITSNGDSEPADISAAGSRAFLLTLAITAIVEQESLELGVFVSPDGATWEAKPVASLPQKFYVGEYPLLVDLSKRPDVASCGCTGMRADGGVGRRLRILRLRCVCARFRLRFWMRLGNVQVRAPDVHRPYCCRLTRACPVTDVLAEGDAAASGACTLASATFTKPAKLLVLAFCATWNPCYSGMALFL